MRVILGGLGVGGGIWSMHFIGMLALDLPIPLTYDLADTASSAALAVIFTRWLSRSSLAMCSANTRCWSVPCSSAPASRACTISGIDAIRGNCLTSYSSLGMFISVAIAVQASGLALWFAFRDRGVVDTLLGAVALGLAIASMHYSGMEATHFLPVENAAETVHGALSKVHLAVAISIMIYSVCGLCIFVFAFRTFGKRTVSPARPRLN